MASEGVPATVAAAILGHAHIATTLDVYSHVLGADARDAAERLGQRFSPTVSPTTDQALPLKPESESRGHVAKW